MTAFALQPRFLGSWSSLWPRAGFWQADPATAAAVLRLSFAPAAAAPFAGEAAAQQPNAAPAAPGQRMPSQSAAHPMEAVSALAQRSARTLWYGSCKTPTLESRFRRCMLSLTWHCWHEGVVRLVEGLTCMGGPGAMQSCMATLCRGNRLWCAVLAPRMHGSPVCALQRRMLLSLRGWVLLRWLLLSQ